MPHRFMRSALAVALLLPVPAFAAALPTLTIVAVASRGSEAGPKAGRFRVARNGGDLSKPLLVRFALTGSAQAGADFVPPGTAIVFGPNVPVALLTVMPVRDTLTEGEESVTITLLPKSGAYLLGAANSATMIIADADAGEGSKAIANAGTMK